MILPEMGPPAWSLLPNRIFPGAGLNKFLTERHVRLLRRSRQKRGGASAESGKTGGGDVRCATE
ncbi:hypothetical protein B7P43_G14074 [Cryptotermes secundus]|uniref:Uncharacterized protein n=1 Tax=Cryptotermes secundus TaxID=105785 RepID=A0A2J7RSB3_9NEOP|nr:hypothetical protein B7P43_G14074 [Cryptotermes secundus]